jgi:hypothetical protein
LPTAVPLLQVFPVRSPVTYHPAGSRWGTATLKFYEGRDILFWPPGQALGNPSDDGPSSDSTGNLGNVVYSFKQAGKLIGGRIGADLN